MFGKFAGCNKTSNKLAEIFVDVKKDIKFAMRLVSYYKRHELFRSALRSAIEFKEHMFPFVKERTCCLSSVSF